MIKPAVSNKEIFSLRLQMAACGHGMTGRKKRNSVSQASVVLENAAEKTPAHLWVARLRLWTLRFDFNLTHTKGGVAARVSQT